ncbi:MAG: RnfABCDGE type electron transport complex subunit D [Arsenophonus sp. ET-YP4-MAG3]
MKFKQILTYFRINQLKNINLFFNYKKQSTSKFMLWVIIAAIPGIICQIYFFGIGIIYQILLAIITALISETVALKLQKLPIINHLKDNSALVTALLLAISIPPLSSWWIIVLGTTIAILIAKHAYGGLGQNIFNPAIVGYIILLILFPVKITNWISPIENKSIYSNILSSTQLIFTNNHYTKETILKKITINFNRLNEILKINNLKKCFLLIHLNSKIFQKSTTLDNSLISINWRWINLGYLIGGIIILTRRIITWQIPVAFLTILTLCLSLTWFIMPSRFISPIIYLFSGKIMLSAFFIATDPVTAAITFRGRFIYGSIIGLLTWIIHIYGCYSDAVAFAILFGNILVPLINYYSQPSTYLNK